VGIKKPIKFSLDTVKKECYVNLNFFFLPPTILA